MDEVRGHLYGRCSEPWFPIQKSISIVTLPNRTSRNGSVSGSRIRCGPFSQTEKELIREFPAVFLYARHLRCLPAAVSSNYGISSLEDCLGECILCLPTFSPHVRVRLSSESVASLPINFRAVRAPPLRTMPHMRPSSQKIDPFSIPSFACSKLFSPSQWRHRSCASIPAT
jgi:hypothetical protein